MYFDKPYNRTIFLNLLQSKMFPNFVRKEEHLGFGNKTTYFVENGIYKLGTVNLDKEITILEIEQKSSNDPRITLTKDAFKILEHHGIDHAIVIFHCKDTSSYRLSLLTVSYENWEKKTSSYKRYSFIVGPNEKVRTVNQQLINKGQIKSYDDLISRFDVEVVRKEFFETYLELFVRLYKAIQKDGDFVNLLESQNVDVVSFTKNLLGKIIFLYFVQQKGWLSFDKNTKYGEGSKNFMRDLRDNFKRESESLSEEKTGYFYNDYLEWLFFAGLNKDRSKDGDWLEELKVKVPYLNGGLFKEEYEGRENNESEINNDIFSNIEKKGDEADGILDIFDRYNFTIDEDSLYDTDIAVDPEMLGRIFEKMISISSENIKDVLEIYDKKKTNAKFDFGKDLNKKLGAFYTPREIVHYMTKESLVSYLQNKVNLSENNIRVLFELKEKFLLNSEDMKKAEYPTETLVEIGNNVINIDNALKEVKILDPAVGSGAFPMGLLHEISSLRYYMYGVFNRIFEEKTNNYKNRDGKISLYKIKKDIILHNIHGVDIDPGAIDIAKLRFWLSLVVDEQEPEPLPNFEFKFVCANSLIPLEKGSLFTRVDLIEKLKKLREDYYKCNDNNRKDELKIEFENIKRELTGFGKLRRDFNSKKEWEEYISQSYKANMDLRNRQILDWDPFEIKEHNKWLDTGLMMGQEKFDIVIGNPPYFLIKPGEYLSQLKQRFNYSDSGKTNIYRLFIEFAIRFCLKNNGVMCYINPNDYLTSKQGSGIRKLIVNECILKEIIEYSESDKVFENVTQAVTTLLLIKGFKSGNTFKLKTHKHGLQNLEQDDIRNDKDLLLIKKNSVIKRMELAEMILDDYLTGFQGEINLTTKKSYYSDVKRDNTLPMIRGNNILKYHYTEPVEYCSLEANDRSHYKDFRIINQQISNQSQKFRTKSALLEPGILCGNSTNYFIMKDGAKNSLFCFLGILNSNLFNYYFNYFSCTNHLTVSELQIIPIPKIELEIDEKIGGLAKSILGKYETNFESDTSDLENEINDIIYKLYGLTDEEIQIVEDSVK